MKTVSTIARAMQSFVIEGGRPLSGRIRATGNKNGALPILAACVLASDEVRLSNVPRIRDVETMLELLADIGADVEWTGPNEIRVDPRALRARYRAATGRRRHRPPPPRHAYPRVPGAGRRGGTEWRLRDAHRRIARQAPVPRRGVGHGDRERDHGRGAGRGEDVRQPRRLRAAHPGPVALPRRARGPHRGNRLHRSPPT